MNYIPITHSSNLQLRHDWIDILKFVAAAEVVILHALRHSYVGQSADAANHDEEPQADNGIRSRKSSIAVCEPIVHHKIEDHSGQCRRHLASKEIDASLLQRVKRRQVFAANPPAMADHARRRGCAEL
jgi:hypothetical protein